jgi:EAL domain-containing protein (putative c-di-GMP-specific phosphodiesterase class I)
MATEAGVAALRMLISRFRKDGIVCILEGLEALWEVGVAETTGAVMVQGFVLAAPRLAGPDLAAWIAQYRPLPEEPVVRAAKRSR